MKLTYSYCIFLLSLVCIPALEAKLVLLLEGNTGAGKTTLTQILKNQLDAEIIPEPLEQWQNVDGHGNLLDLALNQPKRWECTFQIYRFITFLQQFKKANQTKNLHISDRSPFSGVLCFARMALENDSMTQLEWHVCKEMITHLMPYKPDGFIYLRTSPETCINRVYKRGRIEEASLPIDFYNYLHLFYEEWFIDKKNIPDCFADVPVLILDGNCNFADNRELQQQFIDQVQQFIEQVKKNNFLE